MGRVVVRVAMALAILGCVAFVTFSGVAQMNEDPRNTSEDYYDAVDKALCMAHHAAEGMEPIQVSFSPPYSQLPIGEQVDLSVRLRDPWLHQIHDMQLIVNTSRAPDVQVVTGAREPNLENNNVVVESAPVGEANAHEQPFEVGNNASKVIVYASFDERGTFSETLDQTPAIHAQLAGIEGRVTEDKASADGKVRITWDKEKLQRAGAGIYTFRFWLEGDNSVPLDQAPENAYTMTYGFNVYYNATSSTEVIIPINGVSLRAEGESVTVTIPVIKTGSEEGVIDLAVFFRTHFDHPAGTNAANDGHYYRFTTMKVKGGDQLQLTQGATGPALLGPSVDVANLMTRVIGFMTMLLVPVAMVTGGMFGKGSRRWLNRMTGGAKKRVLWHSAMSWLILGVASIHFLLALIEARNTWEVGIFWGGVGWALLVSLGITGYYQVRMIKRWNYKTWRWTHLGTAIGVLTFGLLHTFIEGSDLGAVRDWMPWIETLVWP